MFHFSQSIAVLRLLFPKLLTVKIIGLFLQVIESSEQGPEGGCTYKVNKYFQSINIDIFAVIKYSENNMIISKVI